MNDADTPDPEASAGEPMPAAISDAMEVDAPVPADTDALSGANGDDPSSESDQKQLKNARGGAFMGVPIEVTISVGKARPLVSELVDLRRDSVLPLNSSVDDPVELYIGDRLIARGELQEIGDNSGRLGVRLTEVADISNEI